MKLPRFCGSMDPDIVNDYMSIPFPSRAPPSKDSTPRHGTIAFEGLKIRTATGLTTRQRLFGVLHIEPLRDDVAHEDRKEEASRRAWRSSLKIVDGERSNEG